MKRIILIALMVFTTIFTQDPLNPTIVMLHGDSRFGAGIGWAYYPSPNSVAYHLQGLLGNGYDVRQWGQGSIAVSSNHWNSIFNFHGYGITTTFQKARNVQLFNGAFQRGFPEHESKDIAKWIIVANFGTIDARNDSWSNVKFNYKDSYKRFFSMLKGDKYICLPSPTFNKGSNVNWAIINNSNINEVITLVKQIAQELGISFIDLNAGITANMSSDGIHLTNKANIIHAQRIFNKITGSVVVVPPPPPPPVSNNAQLVNEIKALAQQIINKANQIE